MADLNLILGAFKFVCVCNKFIEARSLSLRTPGWFQNGENAKILP